MPQTVQQLASEFRLPGLKFESGPGGMVKVVVDSPACSGELFLHGGHVTGFAPRGFDDVLWVSAHSSFEPGKPIRGGIPICFPWFGPHPSKADAPAHGLARTSIWKLTSVEALESGAISLNLDNSFDAFKLCYRVTFGSDLELSLKVEAAGQSNEVVHFEEALHTYFSVADIHQVRIEGLEKTPFIDKVDSAIEKPAAGVPICFTDECDRVYLETVEKCVLTDPAGKRCIEVAKTNSRNTVVWNPWTAKSARMPDFGDAEWKSMVCIETANVGQAAISLNVGESHEMKAIISVHGLDASAS